MTVVHHPEVKKICAKAYLEYIRELNTRIETLREGIERKRSLMLPSGIDYSGVPSSGSAADALGNGVVKLQDMIAEYATELAEYVEQGRIAKGVFEQLSNPRAGTALMKYCLQGKTWEQVCVEVGYSYRRMMQIKSEAMLEIYDLMPEEWRNQSIPNSI